MDEWTIIAYSAFGLSSLVSAIRIGRWILNADPKVLINLWRYSAACLIIFALGVLTWLAATGRWTQAAMLAAFLLPILVEAAPRWHVLLGPLKALARKPGANRAAAPRAAPSGVIDRELVEHSAAVLTAYLEHARREAGRLPERRSLRGPSEAAQGTACSLMSPEEALDVLGLGPNPSTQDILEAHRRLREKLDPDLGGTCYLVMKINEARQVLLDQ